MFIKELNLYIDYLQADIQVQFKNLNDKKVKQLNKFKFQLQEGISYYKDLFTDSAAQTSVAVQDWINELNLSEKQLNAISI